MTAPTLTEFLLARIAEDEASVREAPLANAKPSLADMAWSIGLAHPPQPGLANALVEAHVELKRHRSHILAECEAKRRIVDAHHKQVEDDDPHAWIVASQIVLRGLAAIYADHPDYDEAWRA